MADHAGDPTKQPPECKAAGVTDCPSMKCTYEGWDYERYRCDTCGASYALDYEEMR